MLKKAPQRTAAEIMQTQRSGNREGSKIFLIHYDIYIWARADIVKALQLTSQ